MHIPSSQEAKSTKYQPSYSTVNKAEEVSKSSNGLFKDIKKSLLSLHDQHILSHFEACMKKGHIFSFSTPVTSTAIISTTVLENSTTIISPIPSLTPIVTSFGNPSSEVVHVDDITPILPKEMLPSSFFFNKKHKAIVKK
jgi:hypothetical protein